jgi:hypothetical protein
LGAAVEGMVFQLYKVSEIQNTHPPATLPVHYILNNQTDKSARAKSQNWLFNHFITFLLLPIDFPKSQNEHQSRKLLKTTDCNKRRKQLGKFKSQIQDYDFFPLYILIAGNEL